MKQAIEAKEGEQVLWLDTLHGRDEVEVGHVVYVLPGSKDYKYNISWLEGFNSRNDDIGDDRLLAIYDKTAKSIKIGPFDGPSRVTPAGFKWMLGQIETNAQKQGRIVAWLQDGIISEELAEKLLIENVK